MTGKALALAAMLAVLTIASASANTDWNEWIYPRTQRLPDAAIPTHQFWVLRQLTEEDGGYTFHILLKKGEKALWTTYPTKKWVPFDRRVVEHVYWIVAGWNASLKYAAEQFDWGRHLSKLRLKFYVEGINETQIPGGTPDIVIDVTRLLEECGFNACMKVSRTSSNTLYIMIASDVLTVPHELGHALGLDHATPRYTVWGRESRGWGITVTYPGLVDYDPRESIYDDFTAPDTFILYALAQRYSFLKNATPFSKIETKGSIVTPPSDLKYVVKPGLVWAYAYNLYDELDERKRLKVDYPTQYIDSGLFQIVSKPATTHYQLYGGTICMNPLDDMKYVVNASLKRFTVNDISTQYSFASTPLPFLRNYGNRTALVLHGVEIHRVVLDKRLSYSFLTASEWPTAFTPKEFVDDVLDHVQKRRLNIIHIVSLDSLGPGWSNLTSVSINNGRYCLHGVRDRLLVEFRLGRAYVVEAPHTNITVLKGWLHRDDAGRLWVLRNSVISLTPSKPMVDLGNGVRLIAKATNFTWKVDSPIRIPLEILWKKQFYVEVDSPYSASFTGAGWYDEGAVANISYIGGLIELGNATKLEFMGFEGRGNQTSFKVTGAISLKPVWRKHYGVSTQSRYVQSSLDYFMAGEKIHILMPVAQDFGNGTKIQLRNITVHALDGRILSKWDGRIQGAMALHSFTLSEPVAVKVDWKVFHRVSVRSPLASSETLMEEGETLKLDPQRVHEFGNGTKLTFEKILVEGKPAQSTELVVTKPLEITLVYRRSHLSSLLVEAGGGALVEPDEATLKQDGETIVYSPPASYIPEGVWQVVSVKYKGHDVSAGGQIHVAGPAQHIAQSRLRTVKVTVVDLLGVPEPLATVGAFPDVKTATNMLGEAVLHAVPTRETILTASAWLGTGTTILDADAASAKIAIPLSTWTATAMLAGGATGWILILLRKRKPRPF